MPTDDAGQLTLGALLFGQHHDDAGALVLSPGWPQFEDSLRQASAELASTTRKTIGKEVATALSDAEDVQLGDLMIYGWRTHRHLVQAARRTVLAPGSKEVVHLAGQQLSVTREPVVDVTMGGVCVYTAHFSVTVTFDVAVADAVIRDGRLTELTVGGYSALAVLAAVLPAGNVELIRRQHRAPARLAIPLGRGVDLAQPDHAKHARVVAEPRRPLDVTQPVHPTQPAYPAQPPAG